MINGLIDYLLLWLTAGIRKQKVAIWRLMSAASIGGLYSILYLWPQFSGGYTLFIKVLVSLLMVGVAFGWHHPLTYFRNLSVFYLTCFLAGGGVMALHYGIMGNTQVAGGIFLTDSNTGWGSPVSWFLILIGFPIVWIYTQWTFRSLEERKSIGQFLTPVKIQIADRDLECVGLIDTGNQLRDPVTRTPVMVVELAELKTNLPPQLIEKVCQKNWDQNWESLPPEWMVRIRVIPYRVAGREGEMMIAFKPDKVEIWQENEWNNIGKVFIGIDDGHLSTDGTYQAIIHPSCITEIA